MGYEAQNLQIATIVTQMVTMESIKYTRSMKPSLNINSDVCACVDARVYVYVCMCMCVCACNRE